MDPKRWQRVQELFDAAADLSPAERDAYLADACGEDADLRHEVESLLAADAGAPSLLDEGAAAVIEVAAAAREGSTIGPYQIIEELGSGGMGTVYLADRVDGHFRQRVALKVIRKGMDSEQILQRFAGERQILARLQHPNIARLLDGGITPDGVPFFTMEYIEGEPLDRFCDHWQLPIDHRLELFIAVCEAVEYAHRNLVVHRDLKPSNMLVNNEGEVKLLDFGIAKLISPVEEITELRSLTRTGARVMTPGYASPEQIRGEPVTTASDVYSLGVVLYKLLTGLRPYQISSGSPLEVERAVLSTNPNRPSTAIANPPPVDAGGDTEITLKRISEARATQPDRLRRKLSGDLDNICLMALRKEPERRYGSAGHLADDIKRHLSGMPVAARPDTVGYRWSKFIRRNRAGVTAAVVTVLTLAAIIIFYTTKIAQERDRATVAAAEAAAISDFLTGIFEVTDAGPMNGETITARELLDRGAARVDSELVDQPALQAKMFGVIGQVYLDLGLYGRAQTILERCVTLERELYGDHSPELTETSYNAAASAYENRDFDAAETLYSYALQVVRSVPPVNDSIVASILNDQGALYRHEGNYARAESLYTEALAIRRRIFGNHHQDVAMTLNHLARLKYNRGDYKGAEPLFREGLAMRREIYETPDPEVAASLGGLAGDLLAMGKAGEALPLYAESHDIMNETLGPDHPYTFMSMSSLANTYMELGRYDTAKTLFETALPLYEKIFGADHLNTSGPMTGLGDLLTRTGDPAAAEPLLRDALRIRRESLAPDHQMVANAQRLLGTCLVREGRFNEAESLLVAAYRGLASQRPNGDYMLQRTRTSLQELYKMRGAPGDSARLDSLSLSSSE